MKLNDKTDDQSDSLNLENNNLGGNVLTLESLLPNFRMTNASNSDEVTKEVVVVDETDNNSNPKPPSKKEDKEIDLNSLVPPSKTVIEEKIEVSSDTIQTNTSSKTLNYKEVVDKMVSTGRWEKIDTIQLEDGSEIPFEEAEIDEELFSALLQDQEESRERKILEESQSGLTEFTKTLIDIEKKGGDVNQAIRVYQELVNPLESMDLAREEDQIKVIAMDLSSKGLSEQTIKATIKGYKVDNILESEAVESMNNLKKQTEEQLQGIAKQAEDNKKREKEFLDTHKAELRKELNAFELNDSFKKTLVDAATKRGESGKFLVDEKYAEFRRDPKKASELLLFIMNKDLYLEQKFKEQKFNLMTNVGRQFRFVRGNNSDGSAGNQGRKGKSEDGISLEDLTNINAKNK